MVLAPRPRGWSVRCRRWRERSGRRGAPRPPPLDEPVIFGRIGQLHLVRPPIIVDGDLHALAQTGFGPRPDPVPDAVEDGHRDRRLTHSSRPGGPPRRSGRSPRSRVWSCRRRKLERQGAVVLQQDRRCVARPSSASARRLGIVRDGHRLLGVGIGMLEQARRGTSASASGARPCRCAPRHAAVAHLPRQAWHRPAARQIDIDAGLERQPRGLLGRRGDMMHVSAGPRWRSNRSPPRP